MIEQLDIHHLGVIEHASLRLAPGLTVVTGETGAGKTMLVTALELLLGARADSSLVRTGAAQAVVEAVLAAPPGAEEWLADGDEILIVSRELPADGRSRARVGGRLAPVSALQEVLGRHVEVHAQHEHVRLARADVQRSLLDRFAGADHAAVLATYRERHAAWRALLERRDQLQADARERVRERDRLRAELDEIDAAGLDPVADAELDARAARLGHADEVQRATGEAAVLLGAEQAGEPIGRAVELLRRLPVDDDEVAGLRARAEGLLAEAVELGRDVRDYGEAVDADPAALAAVHERLRVLAALTRRYGVDVAAVLAYAEEARAQLAALDADEDDARDLDRQLRQAAEARGAAAVAVREGRLAAGRVLEATVDVHLADLAMPHARCTIEVAPLEENAWGADGADRVTFLLAANPGEPARPIAQAASGGERSRVSLAIEVALADVDDVRVLVFDEVDAGIGGATALAVGEKLARLAASGDRPRQVLCVTHLAQLAAFADVHHVVEKDLADGRAVTTTRLVDAAARPAELARMLGGDPAATAGLQHAQELLAAARARRDR